MAECRAASSPFRAVARRATEVRELPTETRHRLGDEEREDLSEVATLATLEIEPVHAGDGWRLTVVLEDETGPALTEDDVAEGEEDMELSTFYDEYIRSGRGTASVMAEVDDTAAEARLSRLLREIETDRHAASGRA
jgi:hypothetical protein